MRADVFLDLIAQLDGISAEDAAKAAFLKLIENVAENNGVGLVERVKQRNERVEFARHLMKELREVRPVVRERLMSRYQISRAQAYADMSAALQLSRKLLSPLDE